jgi:hypothetical protein
MKKLLLPLVFALSLISARADWLSSLGLSKSTNSTATGTGALAALTDTHTNSH